MAQHVADYLFGSNNWGLCFVMLKNVDQSVRRCYSQIYRLQTRLFPEGAVVSGPVDAKTQKEDAWCCFDVTGEPTNAFNTDKVNFFDNSDSEACMVATLIGVADAVYLLTVASLVPGR
jgi:hypothetical protein